MQLSRGADLCEGTFCGQVTAFADDTPLLFNDSNLDSLQNFIQLDLKKLKYWFGKNV